MPWPGEGLNQMYRETGVGGYSFEFVVVALTHKVGVDSGVGVGVGMPWPGTGSHLETHWLRSPAT